ncbi:MAG: hypothetical protein HC859_00170 [Bacteroidia bacterium]|nr:hypothetical protein [Bacteroidia bacterium]
MKKLCTLMMEHNGQSSAARHNQFTRRLDAQTAGIASALFDSAYKLRWANDPFCAAVGQPRELLEARTLEELRLLYLVDDSRLTFDELTKHPDGDLRSILSKHTHSYWVRVNIYLNPEVQGEFEIAYLMLRSLPQHTSAASERAAFRSAPVKSESRYRSLLEEHPDLISICDKMECVFL